MSKAFKCLVPLNPTQPCDIAGTSSRLQGPVLRIVQEQQCTGRIIPIPPGSHASPFFRVPSAPKLRGSQGELPGGSSFRPTTHTVRPAPGLEERGGPGPRRPDDVANCAPREGARWLWGSFRVVLNKTVLGGTQAGQTAGIS